MSRRRVDTRSSLGPDDEVMPYSDDETDDELEEESSEGEEEAPERAPQPQVETRPTGELFKTCNDPFFFFFFLPSGDECVILHAVFLFHNNFYFSQSIDQILMDMRLI